MEIIMKEIGSQSETKDRKTKQFIYKQIMKFVVIVT